MGLLDVAKSYFRDHESTQSEQSEALTRQRRIDQFGDLPDEIEDMPPEEVANEFAQMGQDNRLFFVRNVLVSQDKWNEMMSVVENSPKQQAYWGLDGEKTEMQDGTRVCECYHIEVNTWSETRGSQEMMGQTQGTSETSKTEIGNKTGGSGEVGLPGVGTVKATEEVSAKKGWTRGQIQQEMTQSTDTRTTTKKFHACNVEPTNSTLSRRAFIRAGSLHLGRTHDRTESNTDPIDDWEMDAERTAEQEQSQKGIDTLREERDALEEQIETLDEDIEAINKKIESNDGDLADNKKHMEQNSHLMDENKESIEKRQTILDERDRLQEKREELQEKNEGFRENRRDMQKEKGQLQTQKSELQGRIEGHEDYEEAQEEADTAESATQDADENASESSSAESEDDETKETSESESAENTADSAGAHEGAGDVEDTDSESTTETNTANQSNDTDTPESDDGSPTDDGGDDRSGEPETDTEEESMTVDPDTKPAQAAAGASSDEEDQSEPEFPDGTGSTDESEVTEDQKEYDNKGKLYLDHYSTSDGQTGGFNESK